MTNSPWRPMDTAPKDATTILAVRDNGCGWDYVIVWWDVDDAYYPWRCTYDNGYPEHRLDAWMPLPDPPN